MTENPTTEDAEGTERSREVDLETAASVEPSAATDLGQGGTVVGSRAAFESLERRVPGALRCVLVGSTP